MSTNPGDALALVHQIQAELETIRGLSVPESVVPGASPEFNAVFKLGYRDALRDVNVILDRVLGPR